MVEKRVRQIDQLLQSLAVFHRHALAAGDENHVTLIEQTIIHLEQELVTLTTHLQAPIFPVGAPSEQQQMQRPHVLVINGDPEFLNLLRLLLQEQRFNVTTTNFVPRSFDLIAALQPSLLVVDLTVGERAGWELLERLHMEAVTRRIPVLAVSSEQRLLERAKADQARYGAANFAVKALHLQELLSTIDQMLGAAQGSDTQSIPSNGHTESKL